MKLERRRSTVISPNIINMVDVMLILFVFLVMSATFGEADLSALSVNLPKATTAKAQENTHFVVTIKAGGQVFFNDTQVQLASLGAKVKQVMQQNKNALAVIRADENVPYSQLVSVMDEIRLTGLERVALAADLKSAK